MLADRDVALIPTMSGWWRMASDRRDTFAAEDAVYAEDPSLGVRARRGAVDLGDVEAVPDRRSG